MTSARSEYDGEGLAEDQVGAAPYELMHRWVEEALRRQSSHGDVPEPESMSVATVDADGVPDVRTVLMRFLDPRGPGFVTCLTSTKGRQLQANPGIAAALTWPSMYRAIRFRGTAEPVSTAEVTAYFQQRPWSSRISAWASRQSEPVGSRAELERAYAEYAARFPDRGEPTDVPVPEHWGALRVASDRVEFWAGRRSRLHDRLAFERVGAGDLAEPGAWRVVRLQP